MQQLPVSWAVAFRRSLVLLGLFVGLGGGCGPKDPSPSDPTKFNVTLNYLSTLTPLQRQAFERAAARWGELIVGDLPDVRSNFASATCGENSPQLDNQLVDDLLIFVTVRSIDGPGRILGTAGPCFIRQASDLTVVGRMEFDSADLDALAARDQLEPTVLHEMGHVLGYGSLWPNHNLLQNPSLPDNLGADTSFSGTGALAAFDSAGGSVYTSGAKVPVENTRGEAGTRDGHWRESVFQNELMTGYLNDRVANILSRVSVASLADLGYQVNLSAAEPYGLPSIGLRTEDTDGIDLGNDILRGSLMVLDGEGHLAEVREGR
jgi:hypothetical protein